MVDRAGYDVVVSDVRQTYVKNLNDKHISTNEPLVNELLKESNIKATTSNRDVITSSDIVYTFVATPSTQDGNYDVSAIDSVVKDFEGFSGKKFVVGCTTNPPDCEKFKKALPNIKVFYNQYY